jgi:hypothetical protein
MASSTQFQPTENWVTGLEHEQIPPDYQKATVSFIWWSGDDSYMYVVANDQRYFCRLSEPRDEQENSTIKRRLTKGASLAFRINKDRDEVEVLNLPEYAIRHRK